MEKNNDMQKEVEFLKKEVVDERAEITAEEKEIKKLKFSVRGLSALILLIVAIGGGTLLYLKISSETVYIDQSSISAPTISLSSDVSGILQDVYVKEGDYVEANTVVARVGDELIQTKTAGIITEADADLGQLYNVGQAVVTMIDPTTLRVVGQLDEDKGLSKVSVGQYVTFTVDAFGSKQYQGVVDEVSPEAQSSDVIFQISDQREEQIFDVKARFDTTAYPELKDGMSARMWVHLQ
ncbi:MAG TPA: HlyD family efflux transporter periplasmic adaptor subunit [Candidatus Paceibacterota bacterium]|nr:HlyD family efflux transporter periplasmic adaptor subunit [Candidatus Paceibacterota bacterium]